MNLSYGSRGDEVKKLQQALNSTGKYTLDVDGSYGPKTQAAVRDYQTKNGLKVDGVAGTETQGHLYNANQTQSQPQQATTPSQQPAQETQRLSYDPAADESYQKALAALQQAQQSLPTYKGSYDQQLQDIYNQIVNRDKFSYDLNSDMLYQQYADQYTQLGQMAMMDTMGQAAALTGGYGSSYGQSVGQQQYDAYLQQLIEMVPELYGMSLDQYNQEGQELMNRYAMVGDMADDEYAKYQDEYGRYLDNLSMLRQDEQEAYERGLAENELAYDRQRDEYDRILNLVQMGYSPSDAQLKAAGMTREEANYWAMLYQQQMAATGGRGYDGGGEDDAEYYGDNMLQAIANNMGAKTNLADRLSTLNQYKETLTSGEYRELYNALIKPYEKTGTSGGGRNKLVISAAGKTAR